MVRVGTLTGARRERIGKITMKEFFRLGEQINGKLTDDFLDPLNFDEQIHLQIFIGNEVISTMKEDFDTSTVESICNELIKEMDYMKIHRELFDLGKINYQFAPRQINIFIKRNIPKQLLHTRKNKKNLLLFSPKGFMNDTLGIED